MSFLQVFFSLFTILFYFLIRIIHFKFFSFHFSRFQLCSFTTFSLLTVFVKVSKTKKYYSPIFGQKTSQKPDIPIKIVKENADIISHFVYHNFNNSLSYSTFPTGMKYADITPIHKKDDETDKKKLSSNKYFT